MLSINYFYLDTVQSSSELVLRTHPPLTNISTFKMKFFTATTPLFLTLTTTIFAFTCRRVITSPYATQIPQITKLFFDPEVPSMSEQRAVATPITSTSTATTSFYPPTPRTTKSGVMNFVLAGIEKQRKTPLGAFPEAFVLEPFQIRSVIR
jgi:hypothetical protein